jgi:hypothetical protein
MIWLIKILLICQWIHAEMVVTGKRRNKNDYKQNASNTIQNYAKTTIKT